MIADATARIALAVVGMVLVLLWAWATIPQSHWVIAPSVALGAGVGATLWIRSQR